MNIRLVNRPFQMTHTTGWLLALAVLFCVQTSQAALLFYDGFDYPVGERLGDSSSSSVWENAKDPITIAADSLTYPGLQTSAGNHVNTASTSASLDSVRTATGAWASQTNGSLYVSFLLNVQSIAGIATSGDGTSVLTVSKTSNNTQLLGINLLAGTGIKLGVLKYPSSSSQVSSAFFTSGPGANLIADGSTVYLVVAKYQWEAGTANDVVTTWVNPTTLGGSEDPANQVSTSTGTDGTESAGRLTISRGPNVNIDEVRIGQTWAEVTPTGGPVVEQHPYITEGFLSSGGFVLRGTNGTPSGVYQVLSSTNLLSPAIAWSSLGTHAFASDGSFDTTNPVSPATSQTFYRLSLGGDLPTAPSLPSQPADQLVIVGQNAVFQVAPEGSHPFYYQWYFNTNTPLAGETNFSLTIFNAQLTNAGTYHVVVSNAIDSVTSDYATLTVVPSPTVGTPDAYATIGSGTTGGAGGPTVIVNNAADFEFYVDNNTGPYVVLVEGTIDLGSSNVRIRDNKTIIGVGTNATLVGDLKVFGNNNVIIQNLNFTNPDGVGDGDGLTLQDCLNIWVDHCTFVDCGDGSLDITHAADWVTVSWCKFHYTFDSGHNFANLIGHSDSNAAEDTGKLHVTFHHNWWSTLCIERMPRVRFGRVHCYNNYYHSPGNNYCIRAARDSEILVENNYFDTVKNVWELYRTEGLDGKLYATNNIEVNTTWYSGDSKSIQIPGTDVLSEEANGLNPVSYPYTLDDAATVPASVTNGAGAGRGPFAP